MGQPNRLGGIGVRHSDITENQRCLFGLRRIGDDVNGTRWHVDEVAAFQDHLGAVAAVAF